MANEDISKQIATGNRCYYPDANDFQDYKERYSAALEMAAWKDQQFKEYLKRKKAEYGVDYIVNAIDMLNEIINELFGETTTNTDREE